MQPEVDARITLLPARNLDAVGYLSGRSRSSNRCQMLGAALAAYDKKVAAGEADAPLPPPPPPAPGLSGDLAKGLAGMHVSGGMGAHQGLMSQSLPSGGKLSFKGRAPHQPLIRPINPSGSMLADLPELDMPEPSPHSNSLLTTGGGRLGELREDDDEEEEGGTYAAPARPPTCARVQVCTEHVHTWQSSPSRLPPRLRSAMRVPPFAGQC